MIDLKKVRLPVQLTSEDARDVLGFLHEISLAAAYELNDREKEIFKNTRAAIKLLDKGLGINPLENQPRTGDCPWCGCDCWPRKTK